MHTRGETNGVGSPLPPPTGSRWRRGRALRAAAAGLAATLIAGCSGSTDVPTRPPVHPIPDVTLQELREAPQDLKFGGVTFAVDVDLWRDFQPVSPPDGQPLAVRAVVTAQGAAAFPDDITSAYAWVIMGGVYWASWMESQGAPGATPNARSYRADGGPKWGPLVVVDVVVGLRSSGSVLHLVRIPDVTIERID